jgi:hypothetical protein
MLRDLRFPLRYQSQFAASLLKSEVVRFRRRGVQREQYRGADWLRPRVQEPQKRWSLGKGERVRIHLPPAASRANFQDAGVGGKQSDGE